MGAIRIFKRLAELLDVAFSGLANNDFVQRKSGSWTNRTPAQVTADLPAFVGDTGSGGTKGMVPAPASGDATKFLKADGTWGTPGGAGTHTHPTSDITGLDATLSTLSGKQDAITGAATTITGADLTAGKVLISNASGKVGVSAVSAPELTDLSLLDRISGASTQGAVLFRGSLGWSALAPGTAGQVFKTAGAGADPAWLDAIDNDAVTNAKLANMAAGTYKMRVTGSTGDPEDATAAQATAGLADMIGDSGSGGTKGLVPAPAAGDAAASKFLKADGTWATVSGSGLSGTGSVDNAILRADGTGGATLQNSGFVIEDATVSTANNVTISNAHSGQTNSSFVVTPKGSGAFIVGPKPDGTTTGGNARGIYAADLQIVRTAANKVASGSYSFLGGGNDNRASASYAAVVGGLSCNATGQASGVLGGYICNTSGGSSGGIASESSTASGAKSVVIASDSATASADYSVASGQYSVANRRFQHSRASGRFAASGDAQKSSLTLFRSTTNATQTEMTIDGASASGTTITTSNRVILNASSTMMVTARIVARSTSGTDNACYERRCLIKRDGANNTVLVGSVQTIGTDIESDAAWDVTIDADDTNESVRVLVTGVAATTIRWVCTLELVEVSLS